MTTAPPDFAIRAAVEAARPDVCTHSNRGAVVFDPRTGAILGIGYNGQPAPFVCARNEACAAACGKLCVHAEQRAIRDALARFGALGFPGRSCELVHAKVVNGALVAGGGPSCWQCSREILDVGIAAVWLYETEDPKLAPWAELYKPPGIWRRYTAREFHEATAAACGLPLDAGR